MAAAEGVYVFDACAVIALLHAESGAEEVGLLLETGHRRIIHALNLCETYYDLVRRIGSAAARPIMEDLLQEIGFEVYSELPASLWQQAGDFKAQLRRLSLADCFAMSLALQENGILVTADHHEFDPVAAAGLCPIHFIR